MPKCGVCGGGIANTLVPHGAICEDDRMAGRINSSPEIDDYASQLQSESVEYKPEVDDIIKQLEEGQEND